MIGGRKTGATGVVVITGGSSGIGRATAQLFARRGWKVGIIARGAENLEATKAELTATGALAATAEADVADSAALEAAAARIEQALGPIDVWINNAGTSTFSSFLDTPADEFDRVGAITYGGSVNGTRVALRRMEQNGRGTIVNVVSAVGFRGIPLMTPYSGAKYGLRGFTEALRAELLGRGSPVHLTMVHPPSTNTLFFSHGASKLEDAPRPPPPVYEPEVVADAIYFAATHRRREIFVTGQTVTFAIANTLMPGLLDRIIGRIGPALETTTRDDVRQQRKENLWTPAEGPHQTRGPFEKESMPFSLQLWMTKNRTAVGLAGAAAALILKGLKSRRPRR